MFTTDSVTRPKVLGGMAWRQSPEEADLRRRPHVCPETYDHDQDASQCTEGYRKVRRPHRERNLRNEKVRGSSPPKSAAGVRVVALPAMLVDVMKRHLAEFPARTRD